MPRTYVKAVHVGYKRSKVVHYPHTSLLKLEGCNTRKATNFYVGKRVAYVYKGEKKDLKGSTTRYIWGKITRPHGNSGLVRAKFKRNLPPRSFGAPVRVMLFPSNI
ncbi:60S ribosomal protein L33 [Thecamonas trahens ATCC 50062]|uniref:60S ribosomal protein L33 n=1 Tax=Thecamonas trahens ATCC 50062 TaxID=461836 RepID=A0A0L0DCC4_THETB|nr:60S ribosomal protein L33 [Thecamonas trahens ATCC 50062]KNC49994.1 60S ribosomal protein L33 [Thecamonas trahens ATCC 50062]|eukprot:XP_013757163.1 60S ribosomal protein L33 [Thecamonas trahens ATCC 50062]